MANLVERAREAAAQAEWDDAYALLGEARAANLLAVVDLPLVAEVAYAAGHLDVTIDTWERVHTDAVGAGDAMAAAGAAVRVAMHLLFDTALMAPVRGWLARADRLLADLPHGATHAWFAAVRAYERLLSGDVASAQASASRAVELGTVHDPAAAAIGRVAAARCLLLDGNAREGLALLDEAGVAMLSGELDALSTGVVYCEVVCALQAGAYYDLAEQWTEAMERWAQSHAIGSLHGRCRVHRAEILRLRGACDAAEHEVSAACDELRPYLRRELGWPLNELGRIRLQRGDVAGAEQAFIEAHEHGWDAQPGLALVHLAKHEIDLAAGSIRYALDHPSSVPSKEQPPHSQLRLAPLLAAQVEIAIAAGDVEVARTAADQLATIAARFESKALIAAAADARGKVQLADGDTRGARDSFEHTLSIWVEIGAPYEAALARVGLAAALRAAGNGPLADVELRAARSQLARLAEPASASRVTGTRATTADEPRNVFQREGDTWCIELASHTVRMRDLKGLHYIAHLLAAPGQRFHVLELVARESGTTARAPIVTGDAGPLLDTRAKQMYRRRLAEIDDDLADAGARNDLGRVTQASNEREFLLRELSRAVGLGGRDRHASSADERARVSVTRSIRQAIGRIAQHHPACAEHLQRAIRTGAYCSYAPAAPMTWITT